jgi:hypothetical protein
VWRYSRSFHKYAQTIESGNYGVLTARCALSDALENYAWLARSLKRLARMARTAAIVSAVAGHDWRARTMMHNDASNEAVVQLEPCEDNLNPTVLLPQRMHAYQSCENYSPASFVQISFQFLSEQCAYYNTTTIASSA